MDEIDWDHTVFVLLAPDALARHLGGQVVRRLEHEGFTPVAWSVLWHRPADLDAFHERNITEAWKTYLYRLVDRLFAFGPTVAMLVHDGRPVDGESSHQRLRRLKGASEPAEAASGTVRGDLRSVNVMLALMHSADSPQDSRRESAVFVGEQGFAGTDAGELHDLLGLMELSGPPERRGFDDVLAGVRARIVAQLWNELSPVGRKEAGRLLADGGLAAVGAGARLADLLPAGHPLAPVLACEFSAGHPGFDVDRADALLRAYGGAGLDRWEDVVLVTSQRFAPRRGDG